MKPIFLIGFMGSGKSTLGAALGRATGMTFIDLDSYIERRFHANVRDLFARYGEAGFRDIERRMLAEVSAFEDVLVACGGGTPCFFDNMDVMNRSGLTVMLDASEECLFGRLKVGRKRRPLIARLSDEELRAYIGEALARRMPYYGRAAVRFPSHMLENKEQIRQSVADFLAMLQKNGAEMPSAVRPNRR